MDVRQLDFGGWNVAHRSPKDVWADMVSAYINIPELDALKN